MNTIDDLFQYATMLRKINSTPFFSSYSHIKTITAYMRALSIIDPQLWDITIMGINDKRKNDVIKLIEKENSKFISLYSKNESFLEEQTSYSKLHKLIETEADKLLYFDQIEAQKEWKKYCEAFDTCNHATRIYNSMDCRPSRKEEDLKDIRDYLDELYDIVGYPVHIEKVNEEHEKLRIKKKEADQKIDEIRKRRDEFIKGLRKEVEDDVYGHIFRIVQDLAEAMENNHSCQATQQKKENKERRKRSPFPTYNSLRECIKNENAFALMKKAADQYMREFNTLIDTQFAYYAFKLLKDKKLLDCAQEHFANLMIDELEKSNCSFKPHSISSGKSRYNDDRDYWLKINFKIT